MARLVRTKLDELVPDNHIQVTESACQNRRVRGATPQTVPWARHGVATTQSLVLAGGLAQACDVVGYCLDLTVIHLGRDICHLRVIFANAITESLQLAIGVIGMLARQTRVL